MQRILSFVCTVLSMTMVTALCEYLLPAGRVKGTAMLGVRLVFLSAVCEEILGIFAGLGV